MSDGERPNGGCVQGDHPVPIIWRGCFPYPEGTADASRRIQEMNRAAQAEEDQ